MTAIPGSIRGSGAAVGASVASLRCPSRPERSVERDDARPAVDKLSTRNRQVSRSVGNVKNAATRWRSVAGSRVQRGDAIFDRRNRPRAPLADAIRTVECRAHPVGAATSAFARCCHQELLESQTELHFDRSFGRRRQQVPALGCRCASALRRDRVRPGPQPFAWRRLLRFAAFQLRAAVLLDHGQP